MVKTVVFVKYEEADVREVLALLKKWPGAGPAEISVGINGTQFVISGDPKAETPDAYMESLIAQANALKNALVKK